MTLSIRTRLVQLALAHGLDPMAALNGSAIDFKRALDRARRTR